MIKIIRWVLFPFTILYTAAVLFRNWAYDHQLYKSTSFHFPVIVIGNLSVGGTGKSPMTEYILRLIQDIPNVAVLSRGYGRKSKGFRSVDIHDSTELVGDEPLQIKRKFPERKVFVCEDRVYAIRKIQDQINAVILDDAYQHRRLRPSFSILLLDYASLLLPIIPLPTGNFRELLHASHRADVIIVTKCPQEISPSIKFKIESTLKKHSEASIFFSKITYKELQNSDHIAYDKDLMLETSAVVLTGIAKPEPFVDFLQPKFKDLIHLSYSDHHHFSDRDLRKISRSWEDIDNPHKIIITTEKDIQRLPVSFLSSYPIYFIPIEQAFLFNQAGQFSTMIKRAFSSSLNSK